MVQAEEPHQRDWHSHMLTGFKGLGSKNSPRTRKGIPPASLIVSFSVACSLKAHQVSIKISLPSVMLVNACELQHDISLRF